jgi:hypothetical protein
MAERSVGASERAVMVISPSLEKAVQFFTKAIISEFAPETCVIIIFLLTISLFCVSEGIVCGNLT